MSICGVEFGFFRVLWLKGVCSLGWCVKGLLDENLICFILEINLVDLGIFVGFYCVVLLMFFFGWFVWMLLVLVGFKLRGSGGIRCGLVWGWLVILEYVVGVWRIVFWWCGFWFFLFGIYVVFLCEWECVCVVYLGL